MAICLVRFIPPLAYRFFCLLLLAALTSCASQPDFFVTQNPEGYSRLILVNFDEPKSQNIWEAAGVNTYRSNKWSLSPALSQSVSRLEKEHNIRALESWPIHSLKLHCILFAVADDEDIDSLLASISANDKVAFAERKVDFELLVADEQTYSDPLVYEQYPQQVVKLAELHAQSTGQDIRVGIIDSAIDFQHPDLKGRIYHSASFINRNTESRPSHGTAVAGVIAAHANNSEGIVGLAPQAEIYAYESCGKTTHSNKKQQASTKVSCSSFDLAKALEQALADELDVLNLSLSGTETPLIRALVEELIARETILVAAIHPQKPDQSFPALVPGVIAVGDSSSSLLWFSKSEHLSTQAGGGYRFFYGSSVAAAGMSGYAAILRTKHSASEVNRLIKALQNNDLDRISTANTDENYHSNQ